MLTRLKPLKVVWPLDTLQQMVLCSPLVILGAHLQLGDQAGLPTVTLYPSGILEDGS